jgi:hypothetical protein
MDTAFTIAALIGGTVMVFQFVMMLLGFAHHGADISGAHHIDATGGNLHDGDFSGSHDSSLHHDAGADGSHHITNWFYEVISIRTVSAAATFFGLAGKTALAYEFEPTPSFVIASLAGAAGLYLVYWLYKQAYRLETSGNENVRNAIGAPATVYVPIAGKRAGTGKVTFRMQNRLVEYLAVTDDEERLRTGEKVVVVAVVNSETVRVARAPDPVPTDSNIATTVTTNS